MVAVQAHCTPAKGPVSREFPPSSVFSRNIGMCQSHQTLYLDVKNRGLRVMSEVNQSFFSLEGVHNLIWALPSPVGLGGSLGCCANAVGFPAHPCGLRSHICQLLHKQLTLPLTIKGRGLIAGLEGSTSFFSVSINSAAVSRFGGPAASREGPTGHLPSCHLPTGHLPTCHWPSAWQVPALNNESLPV